MRANLAVASGLALLAIVATNATADGNFERESLIGLQGAVVYVETTCADPTFSALADSSGLQTKLELALRRAGISVYEARPKVGKRLAFLTLTLNVVPSSELDSQDHSPLYYAISARLAASQALWVVEKGTPNRLVFGDTWSKETVMIYGSTTIKNGRLKQLASDMADSFANDWLASHQR
jgi:hypothetical protein